MDVHHEDHEWEHEIRGEYLARRLVESLEGDEHGWRPFARRAGGRQPVIAIEDAVITGCLDLRATDLPYLLEFLRCRFEHAPDLRQASVAGLVLEGCRFPGLNARNLTSSNDTVLRGCLSAGGTVDLADAQLGGSLLLNDSELRNPGKRAVYGDRLSVAGALLGLRLRTSGEIRIPGAKVGGNLTFSGAALRNRGRYALNANGIQIGGALRCDVEPVSGKVFTMAGIMFIPSATIAGDLRLRDSVLEPGVPLPKRAESQYDDPACTLIADRSVIRGDVQLDQRFYSGGTIRMTSAEIGGDLRMAGARVDLAWAQSPRAAVQRSLRALHLDGTEIMGNMEASRAELRGQVRMIDVRVRGGCQLNMARVHGSRTDVIEASRLVVGSNLDCREAEIVGSLQLQGASIGANLDLRASKLTKPAWHRHKLAYKPSLDLRAAQIARDLVCAAGRSPFLAEGEIQLRRAEIGRQTNFTGAELGDGFNRTALNAFGLVTQELTLRPSVPPRGRVRLGQARCELLADNEALWTATGGVDAEDFGYDNFAEIIEPADQDKVRQRLDWLWTNSGGRYQAGPYDQLAKVFRDNGNEEQAIQVLIEKQRRRYQSIAAATRASFRWSIRLWSMLQLFTVSYGYRPLRALIWLVLLTAAGTTWFSFHQLQPINEDDHPVWNPFLYTVDQLVPIINLGHDVVWQARDGSQWITVLLIAAGWILATTVAAGITRALHRDV